MAKNWERQKGMGLESDYWVLIFLSSVDLSKLNLHLSFLTEIIHSDNNSLS